MKMTLYLAEDCHDCHKVETYVDEKNLQIEKLNVDTMPDVKTPVTLYAFPALFSGDDLLGYGIDIIDYLKQHDSAPKTPENKGEEKEGGFFKRLFGR